MRLDSANRSFLSFLGLALLLGATVLCGAVGGVLLPLMLARASYRGLVDLSGPSLPPVLLFAALVTAGLTRGAGSFARQAVTSRGLERRVRALAATSPAELSRMADRAGLGGRVVFVDAPDVFSFVYGMLTPRVAVSRGLLEGVSCGELHAVLEHERYHVCNLDPLKVVLVRALSAALFGLPALDSLRDRYVTGRELAADRRAVAACGPRSLAAALLKVVRGPGWSELEVAVGIGGSGLLEIRVAQLESGRQPRLATPSATRVGLSLVGAALFAATFLASVSSLGGPAAVHRVTGAGLGSAALLGGLSCAAPIAGAGLSIYLLIALRASRSLGSGVAAADRLRS